MKDIVYLGALLPSTLGRKEVVHRRELRAKRNLAALLPAIHRNGLPKRLLHTLHRSIVQTAMSYELCTGASTKGMRKSLRREDAVMRASSGDPSVPIAFVAAVTHSTGMGPRALLPGCPNPPKP